MANRSTYSVRRRGRIRLCALCLLVLIVPASGWAQMNPASSAARRWRQQHEHAIIDEYSQFLAIPNVASDKPNIQHNVDALVRMMQARGIATRVLTTSGANPVVYGQLVTPGASRWLVFYAHYDGQPVDAKEWASPPFAPTLRTRIIEDGGQTIPLPAPGTPFDPESRLYARSSGDDKVPIMAILVAVDGLKAAGVRARSSLRFVFEGEEEAGSPNLEKILVENRTIVGGDVWFICDTPTHPSRRQQIVFGAPGAMRVDLNVYGPRMDIHGGHYGNLAPNPALMLARLVASMRDDDGRILIKGFADGIVPLTEAEKRAITTVSDVDATLMREFGLGSRIGLPKSLAELITEPLLNIRGLASARVGPEATSVVPSVASASFNINIIKGMNYRNVLERIRDHVRAQGFFVTDTPPNPEVRMAHAKVAMVAMRGGAYNGVRTPLDIPISQEVIRTAESVGGPVIKLPTSGGAVPLEMIERATGSRTIIIPIANHDDNQHGFDENLRIQNLWDGIELMAALLTM